MGPEVRWAWSDDGDISGSIQLLGLTLILPSASQSFRCVYVRRSHFIGINTDIATSTNCCHRHHGYMDASGKRP